MNPSVPAAPAPGFKVTGRFVLIALIAFFSVVAGVNAIMIRLAVGTFGGVETESAYRAGLAYSGEIAAAEVQAARGWRVDITVRPTGADFQGQLITMSAFDAAGQALDRLEVQAMLQRPADRRRDTTVTFQPSSAGRWIAQVAVEPGQWDLVLTLRESGKDAFRSRNRLTFRGERAR